MRPDGSGHLLNYIYYDGLYFIVDMMTQTYENSKYIAKETGLLNDYLNAKYHTGICFCTDSLMKFIYYHSRIQMVKGYKFSYLLLEPYKAVPPCYVEFKEGNLVLYYFGDTNILSERTRTEMKKNKSSERGKSENEQRKINFLKNNLMAFRLALKIYPEKMITMFIAYVAYSFLIFFSYTYMLNYVVNGLQLGKPISMLLTYVAVMSVLGVIGEILLILSYNN